MKKTLLETYMDRTTFKDRNRNPREEGLVATLSDIVEREGSFEHLPQAINKLHEYHRMSIDRMKVKDEDELERVATMMTLCFSMMLMDKHFKSKRRENEKSKTTN